MKPGPKLPSRAFVAGVVVGAFVAALFIRRVAPWVDHANPFGGKPPTAHPVTR